eukprot:2522966-Karenia_brevis.AAC.1
METSACVILMRMASTRCGNALMIMIMSSLVPHAMNGPIVSSTPVIKTAIVSPSMTHNAIVFIVMETIPFKKPMMILPIGALSDHLPCTEIAVFHTAVLATKEEIA